MYFEGHWPSKALPSLYAENAMPNSINPKYHSRPSYHVLILYIPCYDGCSSVAVACCFCLQVSIGGHNKSVTWHLAGMTDSKGGSRGGMIAPHAMGMAVVAIVLVQYRFEIRTLTSTYAWLCVWTACPWCINSWILLWKGVWGRRFLHFSQTLFIPTTDSN